MRGNNLTMTALLLLFTSNEGLSREKMDGLKEHGPGLRFQMRRKKVTLTIFHRNNLKIYI